VIRKKTNGHIFDIVVVGPVSAIMCVHVRVCECACVSVDFPFFLNLLQLFSLFI